MQEPKVTEANPVAGAAANPDEEFDTLIPEDYQLRSLTQTNSDAAVTTFDFSLSATMPQLNYHKQMKWGSPAEKYFVQVNISDPSEAGTGAIYYKIEIGKDKQQTILLKKRFSEIHDYMVELKSHFNRYEVHKGPYAKSTQKTQHEEKCLGYHFIPNIYKPPTVTKVITTYEEGYFKEDFKVRSYFIRNFLLKVLSHSHLAECEVTKNFLTSSGPAEGSSGDGLVSRGIKLAGSVVDTMRKYVEVPRISAEYAELKQHLEWLCKYVRSYNQRMKYLYDGAASSRSANTPAKTDEHVLKGLVDDMETLQYMTEDIWITLDSLIEAETELAKKKEFRVDSLPDDIAKSNHQTWIHNTEIYLRREKQVVLDMITKDCEFLMQTMSQVYTKFTSLDLTCPNEHYSL